MSSLEVLDSFFLVIDWDGINVGIRGSWNETWLEFDNVEDALAIRTHWKLWIAGLVE